MFRKKKSVPPPLPDPVVVAINNLTHEVTHLAGEIAVMRARQLELIEEVQKKQTVKVRLNVVDKPSA